MTGEAPEPGRSARDTARYIENLARDLKRMAAESQLGFLAYLLAMVEDDASATVKRLDEGGQA